MTDFNSFSYKWHTLLVERKVADADAICTYQGSVSRPIIEQHHLEPNEHEQRVGSVERELKADLVQGSWFAFN
jgi:hypothetical protein